MEKVRRVRKESSGAVRPKRLEETPVTGERQVGKNLSQIDASHRIRYTFVLPYLNPNHKVLDYGCGVGYGAYILSTKAKFVMATDIAEEAINYADLYYKMPNIAYSVQDYPMDYGAFDAVTCFELIEHVTDPIAILEGLYCNLLTGGLLFISSPNEEKLYFSKDRYPFHERHYTPEQFESLITSVGFEIQEKHSQISKWNPRIIPGWDGSYMIGVAKKCKDTPSHLFPAA